MYLLLKLDLKSLLTAKKNQREKYKNVNKTKNGSFSGMKRCCQFLCAVIL